MNRLLLALLLLFCIEGAAYSQMSRLVPAKIFESITIDGSLDEPAWEIAPNVTGFKTFSPDFGQDMEYATIVYMMYDAENLYFAYKCFDDEPEKIKASVNSRDNIRSDDWVCINLDSFNDQQALYAFYVNPLGIQMDSRYSAGMEDASVDFVWYSAGVIEPGGYTVEIQIPLKSIRFSTGEPVEMSVFFERRISRQSVNGSYPAMDPSKGEAFLTQMTPVVYEGVKHYTLFELLPAFTYTYRDVAEEGELVKDERRPSLSLTAKYGITSQLILDATVNPDFSQVEADAGQVDINLRYKLFYPEKRSFFLEGSENFNFAGTQTDEYDPVLTMMNTRSIVNPVTGLKLTGKATRDLTVAALYALDRVPVEGSRETESYAHYPVFRAKYGISEDGYLGMIYTGMEADSSFNRVAGVDGSVRLGKASQFLFNGVLSSTLEQGGSDPETGLMASAEYKYDNRNLTLSFGAKNIGEAFYSEPGFIYRTGVNYFKGLVKPKFYPSGDFINRVDLELYSRQMQDIGYNMWETIDHLAVWIFFRGATYIKVKGSYSTEIYLGERFNTGGFHALFSSQVTKKISFATLYRQTAGIYYNELLQGKGNRLTVAANYKPTENIHLDLQFTYADMSDSETKDLFYRYSISRAKLTYQLNRYFFLRAITEYNGYYETLLTDFLASFTYIPGTVVHFGYGSGYESVEWNGAEYVQGEKLQETRRGFFFKCSYLWRF
ncbi:MAG: hypothetical protein E4G95_05480 [Bacteroidia bacterium]|nr:MAG: hypothetical protein E4G95_05480 [Bacteroidia bacterium]